MELWIHTTFNVKKKILQFAAICYTYNHTRHIIVSYIQRTKRPLLLLCNSLNDFKSLLGITYVVYTMQCNVSVYGRFEIPRVLLTSVISISISSILRANQILTAIAQLFKLQSPLRFVIIYWVKFDFSLSPSFCFTFSHTLHLALIFAIRFGFTSNQLNFIAELVDIESAIGH